KSPSVSMLIRCTASGWNSGPVVGAGMGGGALVGFESVITTVLSGLSGDWNMKTSVKSRRRSSPGNFRLSALKWLDIEQRTSVGDGECHKRLRLGGWSRPDRSLVDALASPSRTRCTADHLTIDGVAFRASQKCDDAGDSGQSV